MKLFPWRWKEYNAPVLPGEYAKLLLTLSLADRFGDTKNLGVEYMVGVTIGALWLVIAVGRGETRVGRVRWLVLVNLV